MSNLLKKKLESGVTTFGFPLIESGKVCGLLGAEVSVEPAAEPGPDLEGIFRKKLLELERRTQEIEKEAYGKGFAQGEKDGFEYGQKAAQVVKSQLERIAASMNSLPEKILKDYRNWLIETSLRIAKHIVKRELRMSPEIMADIAQSLLDEADEHNMLTVYFNPQDLEFMEKRAALDLASSGKRFVVKPDPDLDRGGCKVESAIQLLDASIESQFENLENYLLCPTRDGETETGQDWLDSSLDGASSRLPDDSSREKALDSGEEAMVETNGEAG